MPNIYITNKKNQNIFIYTLKKGLIQGGVLSSLICNFLLSLCLKKVVINFENIVKKKSIYGICLNFAGDFIFCFHDKNICNFFLKVFTKVLKTVGLSINNFFSILFIFIKPKPAKFEILGWAIYFKPKFLYIKQSYLVKNYNHIKQINFKNKFFFWLFYPADKSYKSVKKYLKKEIKQLTKVSLCKILLKINVTIYSFCNYFSYTNIFNRLISLKHYCYKN